MRIHDYVMSDESPKPASNERGYVDNKAHARRIPSQRERERVCVCVCESVCVCACACDCV